KEERLLFAKSFMAGPVPLTIAGGIDGKLTLNTSFDLEGIGAYLNGKVAGNIKGFVKGGLSAVILKVNLTMDTTFANTEVEGKVGAKLDITENNEFYFGLEAKLDTILQMLQVSLKVNVEVDLKLASINKELKIWDSPWAFNQSYKLLDYTLPLLTIPSEDILK
ncbi:MAG: hypothetical protein U9N49_01275, partial [Campylobacterota bacterium]|nr:hypothetical protein [Campylobacterota bacterium]